MESGKTSIDRSEGFNFDNQGPETMLTSIPVNGSSFQLNFISQDKESGIAKYEIYINETLTVQKELDGIKTQVTEEITIDDAAYSTKCYARVTDTLGNVTRKDIIARTVGKVPVMVNVSLEERTSRSITINAMATDEDNDKLIYKLYIGTSLNDLKLVNSSPETEQGMQVTLLQSNLVEYTNYYYRIDVTDGINTAEGSVNNVKTKCSGATLTCNSFRKCSSCSGSGKIACTPGGEEQRGSLNSFNCSLCRKHITMKYIYRDCTVCGKVVEKYWNCCGQNNYVSRDRSGHTCSSCKGVGTYACTHGKKTSHKYCSHGMTYEHD